MLQKRCSAKGRQLSSSSKLSCFCRLARLHSSCRLQPSSTMSLAEQILRCGWTLPKEVSHKLISVSSASAPSCSIDQVGTCSCSKSCGAAGLASTCGRGRLRQQARLCWRAQDEACPVNVARAAWGWRGPAETRE